MSHQPFEVQEEQLLDHLTDFLSSSPTSWHSVERLRERLIQVGFRELREAESWRLEPGERVFVARRDSSLMAAIIPLNTPVSALLCASHLDSPSFKLKPKAAYTKARAVMLGVDVYGSPLFSSWLNRDLGIAGRVFYADDKGLFRQTLVNIVDAPVVIPQLAIHLDREVNKGGLVLNPQEHIAAIAAIGAADDSEAESYLESLFKKEFNYSHIYSKDLFLYPLEGPRFVGPDRQLLAAYRIDSLNSVHAILEAFVASLKPDNEKMKVALFWDHEEIGSETPYGAASSFFSDVMERLFLGLGLGREVFLRFLSRSLCLSVDLAHALHPNYVERHEPRHRPLLGEGVVLKHSAQQRYASDGYTAGRLISLAKAAGVPLQEIISRADVPSGSTIGPIHATRTGMATVDIGTPQLSMHAARELISCRDHLNLIILLRHFYSASRQ